MEGALTSVIDELTLAARGSSRAHYDAIVAAFRASVIVGGEGCALATSDLVRRARARAVSCAHGVWLDAVSELPDDNARSAFLALSGLGRFEDAVDCAATFLTHDGALAPTEGSRYVCDWAEPSECPPLRAASVDPVSFAPHKVGATVYQSSVDGLLYTVDTARFLLWCRAVEFEVGPPLSLSEVRGGVVYAADARGGSTAVLQPRDWSRPSDAEMAAAEAEAAGGR